MQKTNGSDKKIPKVLDTLPVQTLDSPVEQALKLF